MPGKKKHPKSKSKSQRRLMGWAQACKTGKSKNCPTNVMQVADTMKADDLESMAKTKEKGKPERVKKESHIVNYNQFIFENKTSRSVLSEEEFLKIYNENCKDYIHTYSLLMRATKYNGDFTVFSKPETPRDVKLSSSITNIINILPEWSVYPNRKVSLIASTNDFYPELWSTWKENTKLHIVIPFDNAKLAMAPKFDFNAGISSGHNENFEHFRDVYHDIITYQNNDMSPEKVIHSVFGYIGRTSMGYYELRSDYNNAVFHPERREGKEEEEAVKVLELLKEAWIKNQKKYNSPFDMFEYAMNPDSNGFEIIKYSGNNTEFPNNEVWTTDNCLLIEEEKYRELVEKNIITN